MLSVLIVNWNTRELLRACLSSIRANPPQEPLEIFVVDNDSKDGSAQMVQDQFPEVTLVMPRVNTGYAKGNNIAFARAKGDWLLTLNPDTEVEAGTLQAAIDKLIENPTYSVLGVKQIGPEGETQLSVRGFPTFWGILGDVTGLGTRFPGTKLDSYRLTAFDYDQEQPGPQPMGTFLLFRRSALERAVDPRAPYDESFPIYFNEVDLLYRLDRAGFPCLYTPSVRILHHHGSSTRQVRRNMIWESHASLVRFLRKHYATPWNRLGLAILSFVIYVAAFIRARGYSAGFRA